jgi:type III secretory pathway component EscS
MGSPQMSTSVTNQLTLAPLGSGDLIDRAVRLYRQHIFVLIRIAAPPVIVAAAGWILLTISFRQTVNAAEDSELALYVFLIFVSIAIIFGGYLFTVVVMGGATRNLVAHLLRNDPVSARATYSAVRARFWGLLMAALVVLAWISLSSSAVFVAWYMTLAAVLFGSIALALVAPVWLSTVLGIICLLATSLVAVCAFFFIVGKVAYVPQIMLVEGKGVFEAVSRSFSLARGNVRRLMAMTLFTTFATYSALMILVIPLSWYGYLSGVDPLNSAYWPAWYAICYSVLGPLSSILLTPVWMLGLSLLYVDERVRHEGYDIELLAAQQLGELPDVKVTSPFGPALSSNERLIPPPSAPMANGRIFNLD